MTASTGDVRDRELATRWKAGDRTAGEALIDRHADALYRFFSTKVNGAVEDLMQKTFLALLEGLERFEGRSSLRTYLFGIARRTLYAYYRENARHPGVDFTVSSMADLCTSPSSMVAREELGAQLRLALQQLPLERQLALELHYWEGLSPNEIAGVLDAPPQTVYSRLRRGREQLASLLTNGAAPVGTPTLEELLRTARPHP